MKFNWIIIPLIFIAVVYYGRKWSMQGLGSWYKQLRKPKNTPGGELVGAIWSFLYVTIFVGVMWFWNVPAFIWWYHYAVGAVLLYNAYLNATWNRTFFVEKDLKGAYKQILRLDYVTIACIVLMAWKSPIGAVIMLPYLAWLLYATKLAKQIAHLNKH